MKKLNVQDLMNVTGGAYDGWTDDFFKAQKKMQNGEYGQGKNISAFLLGLVGTIQAKNSNEFWEMVDKLVKSPAVNIHVDAP